MIFMDAAGVRRIEGYFAGIGEVLGNAKRRASFAVYAMGLLGSAERKSVEPMAALVCRNPKKMDAAHQRLLHFVSSAPWDDRAVRRVAAHYAVDAMVEREPVEAWILDDTGFLKQGSHSVGVQRQYTGSAGKITNCQIADEVEEPLMSRIHLLRVAAFRPAEQAHGVDREGGAALGVAQHLADPCEIALDATDPGGVHEDHGDSSDHAEIPPATSRPAIRVSDRNDRGFIWG
jgi:hypothetical protein